ncbi:MAG: membrane protein insertion efficiency factor YidD [Candidatus Omnitrophota bacterium]
MLQKFAIRIIGYYQKYIRFVLPPACRFIPSCSEYTKEAIQRYGVLKGSLKGVKRISMCHPFSGRGLYDPLD